MLFYATSNRRHLMPRDLVDNERATAINPGEAVEEKVSLSDRFGLWLGFHNCSQDEYLAMVDGYAGHYGLKIAPEELRARRWPGRWAAAARSGRVAWQFIQDLAGELGSGSKEHRPAKCAASMLRYRLRVRRCAVNGRSAPGRATNQELRAISNGRGLTGVGVVADLEMQLRRGDIAGAGRHSRSPGPW